MKKEHITYPLFLQTVNQIKAEGQTPSVRLVRSRIGGSNSTLLEFLRRWQGESALASSIDETISDDLRQALLIEFGRVTKNVRENLETLLVQEKTQSNEANDLLNEAETRISELEAQIKETKEQADHAILLLEKQLSATEERVTEFQRQLDKLEGQFKESVMALEIARTESAKAQIQLERADKTTQKAETKMEELEKKIIKLQESAHQAEIRAAVAEARITELTHQKKNPS